MFIIYGEFQWIFFKILNFFFSLILGLIFGSIKIIRGIPNAFFFIFWSILAKFHRFFGAKNSHFWTFWSKSSLFSNSYKILKVEKEVNKKTIAPLVKKNTQKWKFWNFENFWIFCKKRTLYGDLKEKKIIKKNQAQT